MHPYGTCHPVTLTIKLTEIWPWTGEPNIQVRASFVRSKYKATDTISGATVLAEPLKRLVIKSWFVLKMIRNSDFCDSSSCCDKSCRYTHEQQAAWQRRIVADIALGWKKRLHYFPRRSALFLDSSHWCHPADKHVYLCWLENRSRHSENANSRMKKVIDVLAIQ